VNLKNEKSEKSAAKQTHEQADTRHSASRHKTHATSAAKHNFNNDVLASSITRIPGNVLVNKGVPNGVTGTTLVSKGVPSHHVRFQNVPASGKETADEIPLKDSAQEQGNVFLKKQEHGALHWEEDAHTDDRERHARSLKSPQLRALEDKFGFHLSLPTVPYRSLEQVCCCRSLNRSHLT
jgi:hypothetical protein